MARIIHHKEIMTRVLLIADTERVQRIFHSLEERGVLQLQIVSTLALGESELAATPYDFTFVQSRISGFSGIILLRHLDKILPEGAELALLSGDAEDAAQAKKHGRKSIDLSMDDDMLERTVLGLVTGAPLPEVPEAETLHPTKPAPFKPKQITPPPAAASEPEHGDLPVPESGKPVVEEPVSPEVREAEQEGASPFEEAMQRASSNVTPVKLGLLEVEDRVEVGRESRAEKGSDAAAGRAGGDGEGGKPVQPGPFFAGETLAEAMRRAEKKKSRSPYLIIIPAVVLIAVLLIAYLVGRDSGTDSKTAPAVKPATPPAISIPAPPKAAPEVKQPAPLPALPSQPAAQPLAKPGVKPAPKRGLDKLPPMLEGTRLDADYGKSHPGWVRYVGLRAEYKLFKENDRFRAIQVMAAGGGTISDDLFRRMLREFGGIEGYKVESSGSKGDYVIEQCTANGGTALTIYRNRNSLKMKAFVVYYR